MRKLFFCLGLILIAPAMHLNAGPIYTATLTGANEVPPTGSPATGNAVLTLNGNLLQVSVSYSGLIGGASSAAHIHCCTAPGTNTGVAVPFVNFPSAASGTYSNTFDLTLPGTYLAAFLSGNGGTAATAEAALIAGLNAGMAYVNIHNAEFTGGEIRGFAATAPTTGAVVVPETGSIFLLGLGLIALAFVRQIQRIFSA
jgi:hypothetical protein